VLTELLYSKRIMATTTEAPPRGPQPVLARAKRGSKVEPEPEPKQSSSRFGRVPGTNIQIGDAEAPSWWQWLDSISEDDWKRSICYWYRSGPVTDRQAQGKPISLEKWGGKFDQTDVLNRHGSGRYRFDFCYIAPGSQKYVRIAQEFETILDLSKPPRVPLGEWIDNPANKDWEWAKPLLKAEEVEREQMAAEKIAGKPQPQQNPVEQLSDTIELAQKLLPKDNNTALLIELLKQQDPTKMLGLAKEIAALNQPNGEGSMQMLLMKYLLDEMKEARQSRSNPPDPMEVATNFLSKAKELFGGSGLLAPAAGAVTKMDATSVAVQGATDILGKVIDGVSSHLPDLIGVYRYAKTVELEVAKIAAAKDMNPAKPWEYAGPTAPQVPPAMNPNSAPPPTSASAPMPAPPPPQTYTPEPQAMSPQLFFAKYQRVLQNHFQFLVDNFQHEDGYTFRDHLLAREGQNTVASIRADATVDLLMQLCQSHPQLREIFQPPDKAKLFFTELLTDPDAPGEDPASGDEGEEPAIPEVVS
jgi:hypothetical protein